MLSDHGGHGYEHGTDAPADMTIPWILNGPHIRRNHPLPPSVNITDTAATIAYLLALPIPVGWDEQPVLEAFLE